MQAFEGWVTTGVMGVHTPIQHYDGTRWVCKAAYQLMMEIQLDEEIDKTKKCVRLVEPNPDDFNEIYDALERVYNKPDVYVTIDPLHHDYACKGCGAKAYDPNYIYANNRCSICAED